MNAFDVIYGAGLAITAPLWGIYPPARRKVLAALRDRTARHIDTSRRRDGAPAILIHAVSLGEINATRTLVDQLRAATEGRCDFVITTTTVTGYERGQQLYGNAADVTLIRYPLDFSRPVERLLDTLRPAVAALIELELWPNFLHHCKQRNIPVILINGRITPGSYRNYRRSGPLGRAMFRSLSRLCVQDESFARQFIDLGAPPDRIAITGTMKFDTALLADDPAANHALAQAVGLAADEPIWVCGSTGPGEEQLILPIYQRLRIDHPALRLVIVPRKPERFDEVAALISAHGFTCIRRSQTIDGTTTADAVAKAPAVILGDTMGELRRFYALATVVFVGRSLVDLGHRQHGSDMIEPAALARPVIVGPFTHNFADAMIQFRKRHCILEVTDAASLEAQLRHLLTDPVARQSLAAAARQTVLDNQGATTRHVGEILNYEL